MKELFDTLGLFCEMVGYKPSVDGFPKVRFRNGITSDDLFLITGENHKLEGPIATRQQYENSECSFAHLFPDGRVMRYSDQIGTKDDLFIWYPLQLTQ